MGQWIAFSVPDVVLPDTFWVGLCYNYLIYPPDWYLAYDSYMTDYHTYINCEGDSNSWSALAEMGFAHPFAVRVYVTDAPGIGEEDSEVSVHFSFGLRNNPARERVLFDLALPEAATISLCIYDVSGRMIDELLSGTKAAGTYEISWTAGAAAGVYFYKFESLGEARVGKVILVK